MQIIISPAKKMITDSDSLLYRQIPFMIDKTEIVLKQLKQYSYEELKKIWLCNDKIANLNYQRIQTMNLYRDLTPAILAYEGIQYQYMSPKVFQQCELEYIENHLKILSGFYGILKPFDGIVPYRLEMKAKIEIENMPNLYQFWDNQIANQLQGESNCIINLASKEYSKAVMKYLDSNTQMITCVFGEMINHKIVEKSTKVKMARGEMVRFMAENQIDKIEEIKQFDRLKYHYNEQFSNDNTLVFT